MNNSSFNDYSTVSEVRLGQPGKSGHLHNQDISVWSQSVRIIQVPLYTVVEIPPVATITYSAESIQNQYVGTKLFPQALHCMPFLAMYESEVRRASFVPRIVAIAVINHAGCIGCSMDPHYNL